jgi:hydroxyacylglutathione hydrolase
MHRTAAMARHLVAPKTTQNPAFRVHAIPVHSDNIAYALVCAKTFQTAVVDPGGDAESVGLIVDALAAAEGGKGKIVRVLATHSHWDHIGGLANLLRLPGGQADGVRVSGGDAGRVAESGELTAAEANRVDEVKTGSVVEIGELRVQVHEVPCHTRDSVLYSVGGGGGGGGGDAAPGAEQSEEESANPGCVFTGDTFFVGGCGRFFEGSSADMRRNFDVLGSFPDETQVFVGHEYTVKNLSFAASVDPENARVAEKLEWAKETTKAGGLTVPSTVADERATNPFMRHAELASSPKVEGDDAMAALRKLKDSF